MALLKHICTSITAILFITTLSITVESSIQSVLATTAPPEGDKTSQFRQLTGQFKTDIIDAELVAPPEGDKVLRLLNAYGDGVERIFLGGPDTIPGLLEQYQQAVLRVFAQPPPEGDKRVQHDQIIGFRLLTHAFEKAVISAISDPED